MKFILTKWGDWMIDSDCPIEELEGYCNLYYQGFINKEDFKLLKFAFKKFKGIWI